MRCLNCNKGRPKLWNVEGMFCDEQCYADWRAKCDAKDRAYIKRMQEGR